MTDRNFGMDVIRATAISLVLICHFSGGVESLYGVQIWTWVKQAGFFGVDLFFVLSGFLIAGILLDIIENHPNSRNWIVFMARRWMRTLPLYFAWMIVMGIIAPPPPGELVNHFIKFGTMTQNLAWPRPADNWFGVSWSLAIEEWFYLLFSAMLFMAANLNRKIAAWCVTALFLTVPLALRVYAGDPGTFIELRYATVVYHIDAVAYGAALVLLRGSVLFKYPAISFVVGVALVLFCWVTVSYDPLSIYPTIFFPIFTSLTCSGFALCFPLILRSPAFFKWPIEQLSIHSYGIYIMHLTLLGAFGSQVFSHGMNPLLSLVLTAAAICVLSWLSYKVFEKPILRARPRQISSSSPLTLAAVL